MKALYVVDEHRTHSPPSGICPASHKHSYISTAPSKLVMCAGQAEHAPKPASALKKPAAHTVHVPRSIVHPAGHVHELLSADSGGGHKATRPPNSVKSNPSARTGILPVNTSIATCCAQTQDTKIMLKKNRKTILKKILKQTASCTRMLALQLYIILTLARKHLLPPTVVSFFLLQQLAKTLAISLSSTDLFCCVCRKSHDSETFACSRPEFATCRLALPLIRCAQQIWLPLCRLPAIRRCESDWAAENVLLCELDCWQIFGILSSRT